MIKIEHKITDKETGLEIVLCCCDYNQACAFIKKENTNGRFGNFVGAKGNRIYKIITFENKKFLYDEERGILLTGVMK